MPTISSTCSGSVVLRHARRTLRPHLVRLVVSVRTPLDLYYTDELPGPETTVIYTRQAPSSSPRPPGRLTGHDLAPAIYPDATAYVCGSTGFVDTATGLLVDLGLPVNEIRVERFGVTG
jgi:ferredoxin-NADP reductase